MAEGVEFNDSEGSNSDKLYVSRQILGEPTKPSMINFVKKIGLAKTDVQAYWVLIGVGIFCLLLAAFITLYFGYGIGRTQKVRYIVPDSQKSQFPKEIQQQIDQAKTKKK